MCRLVFDKWKVVERSPCTRLCTPALSARCSPQSWHHEHRSWGCPQRRRCASARGCLPHALTALPARPAALGASLLQCRTPACWACLRGIAGDDSGHLQQAAGCNWLWIAHTHGSLWLLMSGAVVQVETHQDPATWLPGSCCWCHLAESGTGCCACHTPSRQWLVDGCAGFRSGRPSHSTTQRSMHYNSLQVNEERFQLSSRDGLHF